MVRKTIALMMLTMCFYSVKAQVLEVKSSTVNVGHTLFRVPVTAEFEMQNTGDKPLVINDVKTSCGCTSVQYPRLPVPAGESFVVRATYDAKQLGHFHKQVALYSNGQDGPMVLSMRGVIVEEVENYVGNYDYTLGDLQTDANNIEFDDVNHGDRPVVRIHIRNNSDSVVQPVVMHLPKYLVSEVSPTKVLPGRDAIVYLMLNSEMIQDYGLTQTSIYLGANPGEKVGEDKEISVSAVLLPDFRDIPEEVKVLSPQIKLSTTTLELGRFGGKKKLRGEITITNDGQSDLDISRLQMFTRGIQVSLNKTRIAPGETARLKVVAIAKDLHKARSKPRVLMITNDPKMPKVVIDINVE